MTAAIGELDQEAERLADRLEEHVKDKRKPDFEIQGLKGELEERKKCPQGVPPGPSPEEQREQRERDAEKARKDADHAMGCICLVGATTRKRFTIRTQYIHSMDRGEPP